MNEKNEFELYKQGYNDLSKALGKLKIQHQDAKIDVEYLVDRYNSYYRKTTRANT